MSMSNPSSPPHDCCRECGEGVGCVRLQYLPQNRACSRVPLRGLHGLSLLTPQQSIFFEQFFFNPMNPFQTNFIRCPTIPLDCRGLFPGPFPRSVASPVPGPRPLNHPNIMHSVLCLHFLFWLIFLWMKGRCICWYIKLRII